MLRAFATSQLPRPDFSGPPPDSLRVLADMIEAGQLRPLTDRTFPLAQAPVAIEYLQSGQARGKVVITTI